ncbi:hypothetical protein AERYTH_14750 [Aeromicrobium erythreum]|uniref:Uncharacterized protein n=1 Tax=Aeromicrobium erythreum TaxID=2041 RepID=A0A0U4CDA3_9ACTN|nr:hypothetical protein AERYTH_14750 [Aeromicrobium erythreum]
MGGPAAQGRLASRRAGWARGARLAGRAGRGSSGTHSCILSNHVLSSRTAFDGRTLFETSGGGS